MIIILLNKSYGFLLAKVKEEMELQFIKKLSPLKLTPKQYGILQYLEENPNSSQKKVGDALQIDRSTMVSHIDYLEEIQYVQRMRNPKDRRSFGLVITKLGLEKLGTGRNHLENTELNVLSDLSDKEQEALQSILLKVWASIQKEDNNESNGVF